MPCQTPREVLICEARQSLDATPTHVLAAYLPVLRRHARLQLPPDLEARTRKAFPGLGGSDMVPR